MRGKQQGDGTRGGPVMRSSSDGRVQTRSSSSSAIPPVLVDTSASARFAAVPSHPVIS